MVACFSRLFLVAALSLAAAPAARAAEPASFSAKHMTCEQFGSLPADVQPLVIAWIAGKNHQPGTLDAWVIGVEDSRRVVAEVTAACRETPAASFRYKVKAVIDGLRAEKEKKAKAAPAR
jgi:hypothetical protein